MLSDPEKYLYFNVGLLKDSFALDALWKDALKHHMIDHPGQLIALRLTEYYEILAKGVVHPVAGLNGATPPSVPEAAPTGRSNEEQKEERTPAPAGTNGSVHAMPDHWDVERSAEEILLSTSPHVDQNAEEAADYWTLL